MIDAYSPIVRDSYRIQDYSADAVAPVDKTFAARLVYGEDNPYANRDGHGRNYVGREGASGLEGRAPISSDRLGSLGGFGGLGGRVNLVA